jgi:hypothetical protein
VRRLVKSLVRNLVRSLVKSLTPSLSQDQSVSIVSFVKRMVTRESFAIRGERERVLCIRFQHGEIRELWVEASLLAENHWLDSQSDQSDLC